jgi:Short C-terminal domain
MPMIHAYGLIAYYLPETTMTSNHFETLGVWRDASKEEIEQRYVLLRDRFAEELQLGMPGAADRLTAVEEAYSVLNDDARNAAYDETLQTEIRNMSAAPRMYSGYGGAIELHHDHLLIVREGVLAKAQGLGPTRAIPLAAISGITLKPASMATNGHLQLQLGGNSACDHVGDPNAVIFTRKHSTEFAELAELIEQQIAVNAQEGIDPTAVEFDRGTSRLASLQAKIPVASVVMEPLEGMMKSPKAWKLWPDRIETPDGTFPLTPDIKASVTNDASTAFAPVKLLAVGILGATKKRGGVWLTVEGDSFHCVGKAPVRRDRAVRNFAAKVTMAIKAVSVGDSAKEHDHVDEPASRDPQDVLDQIRKLGELRTAGVVTEEEFDAKKAELLRRV